MEKKKSLSVMRFAWYAAFIFGAITVAAFSAVSVLAQSNTLNVGLTITTTTPPPPPPTDNPPSISNVTSTVGLTTASVSWNASDDKGLSNSTFVYGPTSGYGSIGVVTGFYTTSLTGLSSGSLYYYQITVTDNGGNNAVYAGTFTTIAADLTAPNISSINVATTSNSATISWNTNEAADAQIQYGTTASYGSSVTNLSFLLSQSLLINSLLPVTLFHYRIIATDSVGNATTTQDLTFTTGPDAVPPSDVTGLTLTATTSTISLSWTNPFDADFLNVRVVRKAGSAPTSPLDGSLLYTGTNTSYLDTTAAVQTLYYYMVYSYDTSGNRSGGTFVSGQRALPPSEICNNNIDDNFNGQTDCADSACVNAPVCAPPQPEICNNGIDDNSNNLTDCADPACTNTQACAPPATEICGNGLDDNSNNLTDCADPACAAYPACVVVPPPPGGGGGGGGAVPEVCNNKIDDDGNGKMDCLDSACLGFPGCVFVTPTSTPNTTSTVPVVPTPTSTVPVFERLSVNDLKFLTGNRRIEIIPMNGSVNGLASINFTIGIPADKLPSPLESAFISFDGENHAFGPDTGANNYYADFVFPQIGDHLAIIQIDYGSGQRDVINVRLQSLPLGQVLVTGKPLGDVLVTLFRESEGNKLEVGSFGLENPEKTTVNGTFGWVVPNGKYYLTAVKDGFYARKTPVFEVRNNVINSQITLIALPPKLDLNPGNIAKIVEASTQIGLQKLGDTLVEVKDLASKPEVQQTVTTVVAPTVVGVVAVGTITAVSWANLIPLLQLLFLQPLVFFGSRRKREAWGQVYNSLNKLPVDLAAVRLISNETGRVVQSKVTDSQGRYAFVVNPGAYRIEVIKNSFVFPSELLKDSKNDGKKIDIYHGEVVSVSEKDALITANIPMDPVGEHLKPARIRWQRAIRQGQMVIWWLGLIINLVALYISPRWHLLILLSLQLVFYALLKIMAMPPKIKSWGIVYDITNKQPVGKVVARLFNVQFNKLVASQITDSKGRYYFLAGDNEYYITYDHPSYDAEKTATIDLKGHSAEAINVDVGLKPQDMPTASPDSEEEAPTSLK